MVVTNLTREEALARVGTVCDVAYDVELRLDGPGPTFASTVTARFAAAQGASTFLDLVADQVLAINLNGQTLDPAAAVRDHRVHLEGLADANEVRVEAECRYEHTGVGLHRFTDPTDGEVYLYTNLEPFDAHRVFACFDQPDIKARFTFRVVTPAGWEVLSNEPPASQPAAGQGGTWEFAPTALLPAYVTAVVAGPWHSVQATHDGVRLGVWCRRSLAEHLDADEIVEITSQGLDFFADAFGRPYPFTKYDQVWVPEFNAGAMENAGCVTFSERYIFRSKVTVRERETRADTILHELAHMWFGDLVTMRWWDDLWLNESFATYMAMLAMERATRFDQPWTGFANHWKTWALRQDQLPTTHPIVADIPDVAAVEANFDGITYAKGASVLRQLVAWVGQDAFLKGVAAYIERHAWGNTELRDFLGALEEASGRQLDDWAARWLETPGPNTLRLSYTLDEGISAPELADVTVIQEAPPAWPTIRPHRVAIGVYEPDGERLIRTERVELDIEDERTPVARLQGRRAPALLLLNDGDLTYAKIRLDERSLRTVEQRLGDIDDELARSLCWASLWDMLRDGELAARRYLRVAIDHAERESSVYVLQSLLRQALSAVEVYGEPANRNAAGVALADVERDALARAEPGSDVQLSFARAFAVAARGSKDLQWLCELLDGERDLPGLAIDTELRWHILRALAAHGAPVDDRIAAELARDPSDAGEREAAAAGAARPDPEAKAEAWRRIVDDAGLPFATMEALMEGFQVPGQESLLEPYVEPYFGALNTIWQRGVLEVTLSFAEAMYPRLVATDAVVAATDAYLGGDVPGPIRRILLEGRDEVLRVQRARAYDANEG
jgi:aminopeptidase N